MSIVGPILSRYRLLAIVLTLPLCFQISATFAQTEPPPKDLPDQSFTAYLKPKLLIEIPGKRKIHLYCIGSGSPTVIFTAGLGDWAANWRNVQVPVSEKTRTCAWDRAGYGFSDPSPFVQDIKHTTADMEAAIKAANIEGPLVLVGHSMGGYESLLFADKHSERTLGMVLIDPSIPHQSERIRIFDEYNKFNSIHLRNCFAEIKRGKHSHSSPDPNNCFEYDPTYPLELKDILKEKDLDPRRYSNQISLFEQFKKDSMRVVNSKRNYGSMPIKILSASDTGDWSTVPVLSKATLRQRNQFLAEFQRGHGAMARLSTNGTHAIVQDTTHYIHATNPHVVISAINEVVDEVRSKLQMKE
jgi:pimeloyl-ACP methyl ester carboxylesterase